MARNLKFYFDDQGSPCARGPQSERLLMTFLETDVQGDDHICHDLMEDILAIESDAEETREFTGNAHTVAMKHDQISIECHAMEDDSESGDSVNSGGKASQEEKAGQQTYTTSLRHFREIIEDWEAFILDDRDGHDDDNEPDFPT